MESSKDATRYSAVRIDDTAEWRLTVSIRHDGMSAYLRNEGDPMQSVVTLFEERWAEDDEGLLKRIEAAVYDHPQLLDDFSTDIVITTGRALWAPDSAVDEQESEVEIYNKVYAAEEEDIFVDEIDDMRCLYTLVPGLKAFIQRTLPGARTWCQQSVEIRRFRERGDEMPRVYIDIRDGEADFMAFSGRTLLLAATHPWRDPMDIVYHLFNILDVCGLDPQNCQVSLSGKREVKSPLLAKLREHVQFVMLTMMPSMVGKTEMPLAAALLVSRISKH